MYLNAHCITLSINDNVYRDIVNQADLVYSGGIGPIIASKILGQPLIERTPTPDFIDEIFAMSVQKKWSFYFLGTTQLSISQAVVKLSCKFPGIIIKGFHSGYFRKQEEARIISTINLLSPTFIVVGMGTPKQETWISDNFKKIDARVFWAVGAMFDVISGALPRAPKWMRSLGLEWIYRFFQEPHRLWRRYTIGNLKFIYYVFLEWLRIHFGKIYS